MTDDFNRTTIENGPPEGWAEAELGSLCHHPQYGWTTSATKDRSGLRLLRTTDISSGQVEWGLVPVCKKEPDDPQKYVLSPGDIVVSRAGSVGVSYLVGDCPRAVFASYLIRLRPVQPIPSEFISLFLKSPGYWDAVTEHSAGIAVPNINATKLARMIVPVPPLAEQKRIVAMVEKLLARVNAARERLAKVPAILKRFRQSVLAAACSGRLTADWRAAHPDIEPASELLREVTEHRRKSWRKERYRDPIPPEPPDDAELPDGWAWASLEGVASQVVDCPHATPKWTDHGRLCVRTTNFHPGRLDLSEVRYVSDGTFAERIKRLVPQPADILYSREGGILGIACMIPEGVELCMGQRMMLIRPYPALSATFYMHVLNSELILSRVRDLTGGTASPHLNVGDIKAFAVPVPPAPEQHEIVRRVEALFKLADTIEQRVTAGTQRADRLTQAVLAKAFRGELVPTEAELARREGRSYEPASALLDRIKAEREAASLARERVRKVGARPTRKPPKGIQFKRAAIAAYAIVRLHDRPTFGRTQLEKLLYLTQSHLGIDLAMEFQRKAAGPFDAEIHKLESLAGKRGWFTTHKRETFGYRYQPGDRIDDRVGAAGPILSDRRNEMDRLLDLFARMKTEQAELFATVFAAWNDFLLGGRQPSEEDIIREIRENWHEAKERFAAERIKSCIEWIRWERFVPRGVGAHTVR